MLRKHLCMLLLILLFGVAVQFSLASGEPSLRADAPEAAIDVTRRDLGEVFAGEELEYAFIVRNTGTKTLELAEKTTASFKSERPGYGTSIAMWRSTDRHLTRPVAFMLTAPRLTAPRLTAPRRAAPS